MVDIVLEQIREKLSEYLAGYYDIPGEMVGVGLPDAEGELEGINQMMVGLLNIERESVAGISARWQAEGKSVAMQLPPWHLNIYFVLAAVFEKKQYGNGLKMLSDSLSFFQQHVLFEADRRVRFTVEPVSLSIQELANVWSILGGCYYPSMIFKLRMLTFDGDEMVRTTVKICKTE